MRDAAHPQGSIQPLRRARRPIDPEVRIGHVHLRTTDLGPIREFYVDVLGFDVVTDRRGVEGERISGDVLCLSAGGYHHHLAFNVEPTAGPASALPSATGLHHVALNFPTLPALADAVRRLERVEWPLRGLRDFGTHISVYLDDPDGNGLELAWDRPVEDWPDGDAGWNGGETGAHAAFRQSLRIA